MAAKKKNAGQAAAEDRQAGPFVFKRELKITKPLMKGADVEGLQRLLIARKLHCGDDTARGIYGAHTAQAVRHFQSMNRVVVNGRAGKHTVIALGGKWEG
jgi:peptidoglycan hydrolase-like protein with peptidoglycan-binding domain